MYTMHMVYTYEYIEKGKKIPYFKIFKLFKVLKF